MISGAELCRSQLTRTLYHNAESLSSVWRRFLKKISGIFFGLGGGQFFSLNVALVISVEVKSSHFVHIFSLITSTEYIKSVTNYSCITYILFIYFSYILLFNIYYLKYTHVLVY